MKVIKIIVDTKPPACYQCPYSEQIYLRVDCDAFPHYTDEGYHVPNPEVTPSWCPLEVEKDMACNCQKCNPESIEKYYEDEK